MKQQLRLLLLASASLLLLIAPLRAAEKWNTFPPPPAMPAPGASGYARVNGINMYYSIYGKGDPILLIHGGLGNGDIWSKQVMDLAENRMVIVADSRGHGRSSLDSEPFSYELMAADYIALLNGLHINKVAVAGWSDGANIGLAMAMSHPEMISGVFAHAPNATPDGYLAGGSKSSAFQAYARKCASDYQLMSKTPGDYSKLTAKLSPMWRSQPNWTRAQLAAIKVPVWVILGDHDEIIKREHAKYISSVIPNSRLEILKDTGHFSVVQDPALYTDKLLAFLNALQQEPSHQRPASGEEKPQPETQKQQPGQERHSAALAQDASYLPNLDNAEVNRQKIKGYLTASGYGRSGGKATSFIRCGFKVGEIDAFIKALLEHSRRNKVSRIEETAQGTRYEVEGRLPCADGHEESLRAVWFIDSGASAPHLLSATPYGEPGR